MKERERGIGRESYKWKRRKKYEPAGKNKNEDKCNATDGGGVAVQLLGDQPDSPFGRRKEYAS